MRQSVRMRSYEQGRAKMFLPSYGEGSSARAGGLFIGCHGFVAVAEGSEFKHAGILLHHAVMAL